MIFEFNDCQLDVDRVVLRRAGSEVPVEPQVFDVLQYLVERRGEVVLKEALLDGIWGDRFVSESALTSRLKSARRAVGDDGTRQGVIRTVHGRGYEFVADVRVIDGRNGEGDDRAAEAPHELPVALQRLIGRDELLEALIEELRENRLVTLVGSAGVGKTSLGLELARAVAPRYEDGVFLVELVTVGDRDAAFASLAGALGVNTGLGVSIEDSIVDMLRGRNALVLLDNCEHLVEPIADIVERILRAAPLVSIVATSREPLAVMGEHVRPVTPLPVDDLHTMAFDQLAHVPAVALFMERAQAADPGVELTERNASAVVEICQRLDGIPLALELAASRAKAIDVTEIASRLDERFRLLKGVRRGADPRHRTLQDAIGWSYELLDEDEKRVFASLAVFAGQFDLDAAESISTDQDGDEDDVLDVLTRLTERSMLAVRRPSVGGTRYEMLETLREYGRNRLDDARSVTLHSTHARHFAAAAATIEADLCSAHEGTAAARADSSYADLRAAQRFSVEIGDVDTAFGLVCALREYGMRTLHYEVFTWADAMSDMPGGADHPAYPVVLSVRAYGAFCRGEFDRALDLAGDAKEAEQSLAVAPVGLAERVRANVYYAIDELDRGIAENARLIELADASGNDSRRAHAHYMASVAASSCGDYDEGHRLSRLARRAAEGTGGVTDLACSWVAEGFSIHGDDALALSAFAHGDRLARSVGNRWLSAFARTEIGALRVSHGDLASGCEELAEQVDTWYRTGEWAQQWHTLMRCVIALDRIGQPAVAAEVLGSIEAHSAVGAPPLMVTLRDLVLATRDSIEAQLGADRSRECRAAGALLPVGSTVERTRLALRGLSVAR
ncbi:MAG TPA: winged helix-turn-helix domain-containing protein [Ilumatobacteraceae bacterium]|nr:winged helix-turn-helix domain-containing protein [Ilumatobacteraceae bacterium]